MAQTKRKRQTKHRGNAAGVVEARGRTGRKPTAAEKSGKAGETGKAKGKPVDRRDRPPTWKGAFWRGLAAAMVLVLIAGLVLHAAPGQEVAYFVLALIAYTPMSYYTDRWVYRRRQRSKGGSSGGRTASG
jgi:hypothetical protein